MYCIVSFCINFLFCLSKLTDDVTNPVGATNTLFDITFCAVPATYCIPSSVGPFCVAAVGEIEPVRIAADGYR